MGYTKRKLEELNVLDDFMISTLAADDEVGEDFCRELLSILLQRKIGQVKVVTQKTIMALSPEYRGIRLDVEVNEAPEDKDGENSSLNVYDIESHLQKETDLPRHNRFYQAKMDGRYLKSGEKNFNNMPNLYVITITDYDPFGKDYMVYTVHNKCEEEPDLEYDDGLKFYYFNSEGSKGGSSEIRELLLYLKDSKEKNAVNDDLKKIHQYVKRVKLRPEVREEYMRFDEIIKWERAEERVETQIEVLIQILEQHGKIPDKLRESIINEKDTEVLDKMLKVAITAKNIEQFEEKMGIVKG